MLPSPPKLSLLIVATKSNVTAAVEPKIPSFEEAMARLEVIVEKMESGDVPLDELLAQYEEGSRLLAVCEQRLKAAELKIEQLKRRKDPASGAPSFQITDFPDPA